MGYGIEEVLDEEAVADQAVALVRQQMMNMLQSHAVAAFSQVDEEQQSEEEQIHGLIERGTRGVACLPRPHGT